MRNKPNYKHAIKEQKFKILRASVGKNQANSEISGKNVKIQICSNSGY